MESAFSTLRQHQTPQVETLFWDAEIQRRASLLGVACVMACLVGEEEMGGDWVDAVRRANVG